MGRGIRVFVVFCAAWAVLCAGAVYVAGEEGHWKTEHTYIKFSTLIGKIIGIANLAKDDELAAFDKEGNCYGKGRVRDENNNYALSLFPAEPGGVVIDGVLVPDDFAIPGLLDGEEVVFKVYVRSEGAEYALEPARGGAYRFIPQDGPHGFPPTTLDLVYEPAEELPPAPAPPPPEPEPEPEDQGGVRTIAGALPTVKDTGETGPKPVTPPAVGKKALPKEEEAPPPARKEPTDYYRPPPSEGGGAKRVTTAPKKPVTKKPLQEIPYSEELEVPRKKPPEIPETEIKSVRMRPFWIKLVLLLSFSGLLFFAARKLLKMRG